MNDTNSDIDAIETAVAERIDPLLELDRGTCEVIALDEKSGVLSVRLGGSYRGSPARETLVRDVIEPILKEKSAKVSKVVWID